jgi:hypothetical protein
VEGDSGLLTGGETSWFPRAPSSGPLRGRARTRRGLLGLIAVACFLAAHASAAPAPTLFQLSVTGTATHQWTHTGAPEQNGNCTRTVTSEGIRKTQFRTARPVLVRLLEGRVLTAELRGLTGTVTLVGANTTDERCGEEGTGQIADCAQTKRSFGGGKARVSSPRARAAEIGAVRGVRLRDSDCPLEPLEVKSSPLGPRVGLLGLADEALEERVSRITVRASRSRRVFFAAPAEGSLREQAQWKLTFVRVKR